MKFLFIHQNFPGQYVHIVCYLAQAGHQVTFITQPRSAEIAGVRKLEYQPVVPEECGQAYLRELEKFVYRSGQLMRPVFDVARQNPRRVLKKCPRLARPPSSSIFHS